MKTHANLTRQERIAKVMSDRKNDFCLILENLAEANNISAILRTAEAFGVGQVCIIYDKSKPRLSMQTSSGASKWLNINYFDSTEECLTQLKKQGFTIVGALVDPEAKVLWNQSFEGKVAIMVGTEVTGLTEVAQQHVDHNIYLPMIGLTESLNVSVSAAIFLYEVIRQKEVNN